MWEGDYSALPVLFYKYYYFQEQILNNSPPQSHCPAPGTGLVSRANQHRVFPVHLFTKWGRVGPMEAQGAIRIMANFY